MPDQIGPDLQRLRNLLMADPCTAEIRPPQARLDPSLACLSLSESFDPTCASSHGTHGQARHTVSARLVRYVFCIERALNLCASYGHVRYRELQITW